MSKNEIEAANRIPNSNFIYFSEFFTPKLQGILQKSAAILDEGIRRTAFVIQEVHIICSPSLANQKFVRIVLGSQIFLESKHRQKDDACWIFLNFLFNAQFSFSKIQHPRFFLTQHSL